MSGPFFQRYKVVSHSCSKTFNRELTRLSQEGWLLLDSGYSAAHGGHWTDPGTHWAHLSMGDTYKRVAEEDQRVNPPNRRSFPYDRSYGSHKAERRKNGAQHDRRTETRRNDAATGVEDKARRAAHEKRGGGLPFGQKGVPPQ